MPLPSSIVKASSLAKWVRQLLGGISKSGAPSLAVVQGTTIIKELDPDYIFPGRLKKVGDKVDVFPFCVIASYFFAGGPESNVGDSYQLGGEVELEPGEFLTVRITHNGTWDVDPILSLGYEVASTEVEFEVLTTIPNAAPATVTYDLGNDTIISQNGLSEQWFVIGWRTPDGQLVNRDGLLGVYGAGTGTYFFMPLVHITTI